MRNESEPVWNSPGVMTKKSTKSTMFPILFFMNNVPNYSRDEMKYKIDKSFATWGSQRSSTWKL